MSNVCIITARGGSKRIPHKNVKDFCGKPIIAYSIEAALESGLFDEVMVSTDSKDIATVAKEYGANVPFMRSAKNSDDFATTADVLLEVLNEYEKRGKTFDVLCCLYPTAPFVTAEKLVQANQDFTSGNCDAICAMVQYSFPPQRGFVQCNSHIQFWQPENEKVRSQDLEPIFHDAGQFYFIYSKTLRKTHSLLGQTAKGLEVCEMQVQDIDTLSDWEIAEMKYKRMIQDESA